MMACRLLILASLLLLAGCFADTREQEVDIVIDGSSTVFPIVRYGAQLFESDNPDYNIQVDFSGTTAGFRTFCTHGTDINPASREINREEITLCRESGVTYEQFQIALDAVAIVTHRRNTWIDAVTLPQLQLMWAAASEGEIQTWQQVDPEWPDSPINLYGRGKASGTYDFFTEQLGALRSSREDYVASEDEEYLAAGIARDPASIGFFGLGAYHRHWEELRLLAVDHGSGAVFPSLETVRAGQYQPFTRPLFVYVRRADDSDVDRQEAISHFLRHFFEQLPQWVHNTGYLPMTDEQYRDLQVQLENW
jgi:phosphate transport system substrate-binding protein